jgi:hypothetical protein
MAFVFSLLGRRTDNEIWQANNKVETRILTHLELILFTAFSTLILLPYYAACFLLLPDGKAYRSCKGELIPSHRR